MKATIINFALQIAIDTISSIAVLVVVAYLLTSQKLKF
jgi:hypothetical protein